MAKIPTEITDNVGVCSDEVQNSEELPKSKDSNYEMVRSAKISVGKMLLESSDAKKTLSGLSQTIKDLPMSEGYDVTQLRKATILFADCL